MTYFYRVREGLFYRGEEVTHRWAGRCIKDESEVKNLEWHYTWANIHELCNNSLMYAYTENRRKGRVLHVNSEAIFREWKDTDMELTLKVEYKKHTPSLYEVVRFYDGEKAIQWMLERGLHTTEPLAMKTIVDNAKL